MLCHYRLEAHGGGLAKVVAPAAKQDAVGYLCKTHQASERRACSALGVVGRVCVIAASAQMMLARARQ